MADLDDQIRAWADAAPPISADEVRRAAGDDARGAPGLGRRRSLLAAAAVVLVVAAVAALVAVRGGDGSDRVRTDRIDGVNTSSTSPSTTEGTGRTTVPERVGDDAFPPWFVAHLPSHQLAVVDSVSGRRIRTLASFDDPNDGTTGQPTASGSYLGHLALSPDRKTVFFDTCCEPAVGEVFRVAVTGGKPHPVTTGSDPAVSPDGSKLAVLEGQALKVIDLATGKETRYPLADNAPAVALANPAWSPDGSMLALERYDDSLQDGRVVLVTFDGAEDDLNAASTVASTDTDGTPRFPAFDADGRIQLIREHLGADGGTQPVGSARLEVYDPYQDAPVRTEVVPAALAQRIDATGRARLVVRADGTVELSPTTAGSPMSSQVLPALRLVDAAW